MRVRACACWRGCLAVAVAVAVAVGGDFVVDEGVVFVWIFFFFF